MPSDRHFGADALPNSQVVVTIPAFYKVSLWPLRDFFSSSIDWRRSVNRG